MRSLSDLLAAASDDEELKKAVRRAVEANQDAQAWLSAIIGALAIPRDTQEEAPYGPSRKLGRRPLRPKSTHTVFSAFAVAVLALGLGGGCLLLAHALTQPDEGAKMAAVTPRGPPMIDAAQPVAPTGTTGQEEPPGKLEGAVVPSIALAPSTATGATVRGDVAGNIENAPAASMPGSGVEVAKVTEDSVAPTDQPGAKTTTDELEKSGRIEPPGQSRNQDQDIEGALPTIATAQPAVPTGTAEQEEPSGKPEGAVVERIEISPSTATVAAERGEVAGNTEIGPPASLPGSGVEVAKVTEDSVAPTDQPGAKTTTDELEKSARVEPPGQNQNQDKAGALSTIAAARPPAPTGTTGQEEPPGKLEGAVVPSIALAPSRATGAAGTAGNAGDRRDSAKAVTCQTSGPAGDGHWAWRLIDGRKCWYKGAAGMDKSLLHWPPREHVPELQ